MTTLAEPAKTWYKINEDVEYSTDFKFFSENQIRVIRTGSRHSFCSRLEPKKFSEKTAFNKNGTFDDCDIIAETRKIHQEILTGNHGKGELVN